MTEDQEKVLVEAVERITVVLQTLSYDAIPQAYRGDAGMLNLALCDAFPWLRDEAAGEGQEPGPPGSAGRSPQIYTLIVCPLCRRILRFEDNEGMYPRAECCEHWWLCPEHSDSEASAAITVKAIEAVA